MRLRQGALAVVLFLTAGVCSSVAGENVEVMHAVVDAAEQPRLEGWRLSELFERALAHDDRWVAAQARQRASREVLPIARSRLLPQLHLSGSVGAAEREHAGPFGGMEENQFEPRSARIELRQPLVNLTALSALRMAHRERDIAAYELALERQELLLRVIDAYMALLLAQEQLELVRLQLQAIDAQRNQAERMWAGGVATQADVQEAQARLDLVRARELEALNQRDIRRRELYMLTGVDEATVQRLDSRIELARPEPDSMRPWVELAREQSFEARISALVEQSAIHGLSRARSQYYPTLDLVVSHQRLHDSEAGYRRDRTDRAMLELRMPLYQGGRVRAETREASARHEEMVARSRHAREQSGLAAGSAWLDLGASLARLAALEQAVHSSEVALRGAEVSLTVAYRTFVDVLNAQQQLYQARFERLEARIDYMRAWARLRAAIGTLDDSVVHEIDSWLEERE